VTAEKVSWRDVTCRHCNAGPGRNCRGGNGREQSVCHAVRSRDATKPAPAATRAATSGTGLVYGYTLKGQVAHIVSAVSRQLLLCGRRTDYIPQVQPQGPKVCGTCESTMELKGGAASAPGPVEGDCPVCGSEEALNDDGLVVAHNQLVVGRTGLRRIDKVCSGGGEPPEVLP
jgi:hypothetical protein